MNAKKAAKISLAMDIIRENCANSTYCEGCPFEFVCYEYWKNTRKKPVDWKIDE